jgi:transposase
MNPPPAARKWTDDRLAVLREMVARGETAKRIAEHFCVSKSAAASAVFTYCADVSRPARYWSRRSAATGDDG